MRENRGKTLANDSKKTKKTAAEKMQKNAKIGQISAKKREKTAKIGKIWPKNREIFAKIAAAAKNFGREPRGRRRREILRKIAAAAANRQKKQSLSAIATVPVGVARPKIRWKDPFFRQKRGFCDFCDFRRSRAKSRPIRTFGQKTATFRFALCQGPFGDKKAANLAGSDFLWGDFWSIIGLGLHFGPVDGLRAGNFGFVGIFLDFGRNFIWDAVWEAGFVFERPQGAVPAQGDAISGQFCWRAAAF
ncbi:MAG TPA: hypothetical protein VLH56_11800 [Dissulfurispiraceae bacterium]|nr:hypothetical protein [Dissulfurispiraceae bacterium]